MQSALRIGASSGPTIPAALTRSRGRLVRDHGGDIALANIASGGLRSCGWLPAT